MKALKFALYSKTLGRIVSTHRSAEAAGRAAAKIGSLRPELHVRHTRPGVFLLGECYGPFTDELHDRDYTTGLNGC